MKWSMDTHKYMSELTRKALQILAENHINSDSEPDAIESAERKLADAGVYKDFDGAKGRIKRALFTYFKAYDCMDTNGNLTEVGSAYVENKLSLQEFSFYYVVNYLYEDATNKYYPLQLILKCLFALHQISPYNAYLTAHDFSKIVDCDSLNQVDDSFIAEIEAAHMQVPIEVNERAIGYDVWAKMLSQAGIVEFVDHKLKLTNTALAVWILESYDREFTRHRGSLTSGILQFLPAIPVAKSNGNPAEFSGEGLALQAFLFDNIPEKTISKYITVDSNCSLVKMRDALGIIKDQSGFYSAYSGLERLVGHVLYKSCTGTQKAIGEILLNLEVSIDEDIEGFELPDQSLLVKTEISEEDFRDWLSKKVKNDGQPLSTTYQNAYYYILKAIPSMLGFESVFSITDPVSFKQYRQRVEASAQYQETNPNLGVGILSSALTNYGKYLEERNMLNIPAERLAQILKDWYTKKYVENNITSTLVGFGFKYARPINNANISSKSLLDAAKIESTMAAYIDRGKDLYAAIEKANIGITVAPALLNTLTSNVELFDYATTKGIATNMIFFGTPGCGKSYHIEHDILGKDKTTKEYTGDFLKENIIRTTFYQDYSYTDFVGQILPKIVKGAEGEKDTVEYIFNPGPFTLALIQAISNPTKKVALVVEEINRGNAPAIFGDIFQLLDRDENNISEYGIVNVSMIDYLNDFTFTVDGVKKTYKFTEIKIPGNLYIYATMNTSDQNVYTLDTAFVRRWDREKIKNTFAKCTFKGKKVPGMDCTWQKFVDDINACIASHLEDLQVNEDKQIGAFFVKESLLSESAEKFAYKVFDYLWNDVAKLDHGIFFNHYDTLDALIAAYVEKGAAVFKPGIFKEKAATPIQSEATDEQ